MCVFRGYNSSQLMVWFRHLIASWSRLEASPVPPHLLQDIVLLQMTHWHSILSTLVECTSREISCLGQDGPTWNSSTANGRVCPPTPLETFLTRRDNQSTWVCPRTRCSTQLNLKPANVLVTSLHFIAFRHQDCHFVHQSTESLHSFLLVELDCATQLASVSFPGLFLIDHSFLLPCLFALSSVNKYINLLGSVSSSFYASWLAAS